MASFRSSAAYRIAVIYAAVLVWTVLLLGMAVFFTADGEFRRQRDREIAEELDRLSHEPDRAELLRELNWRQAESATNRFRYGLFDRQGKRIAGAIETFPSSAGFTDLPLRGVEGGQERAVSGDIGDGHRLVVSTDGTAIDRIHAMIFKFFVAAFVAVLMTSALGGLALGWYLRRRLHPISATANAIVTGDIEWRAPVGSRGDEFDTAARALNLMLDRIAGLMENLRQVSSDIAHDLRKPLIRLLNQTDRLGQVAGAEQRVVELGDEMLMLFASILRIAEVEGGGLERGFTSINLSGLMGEVAETFAPALADGGHSIDWTIEPDIAVMGNRELLAQMAANLLDNARIHTPAGTAIVFRLASEGSDARLSVEDNGPGVSEDDRDKVLQRFFRAETSRTTPGNGLGLSLVAAVARAHNGTVTIEDAGPGFRVIVTLPGLSGNHAADAAGLSVRSGS
jgi:signal transduction histidine kinase